MEFPGAIVPPESMIVRPTMPLPPSVPAVAAGTTALSSEPSTANVPPKRAPRR